MESILHALQQIPHWIKDNWTEIAVVFLAFSKFMKEIRDAIDKTPDTDDNAFERFCTVVYKMGASIFMGKRPQ